MNRVGSKNFAYKLLFSALALLVLIVLIFYRSGFELPTSEPLDNSNNTVKYDSTKYNRIRSHEIREHKPLIRFHDPSEGPAADQIRIAYLISVHNTKTIQGAVGLVDRLYEAQHTFVIHVDKKVNDTELNRFYKSLAKFKSVDASQANEALFAPTRSNNLIVIHRYAVNWCGFSMIQMSFDMISAALQTGRWWDTVVVLSGECYPVKPAAMIEERLLRHRDKLFLALDGSRGHDEDSEKIRVRFSKFMLDSYYVANVMPYQVDELPGKSKNYPPNLNRFMGTQWVVLSRDFAEYVITSPWVKKLFLAHSTSSCPDESTFQLIANNSPFVNNTFSIATEDTKMRYEEWKSGQGHPSTLSQNGGLKAVRSSALYARKIEPSNQALVASLVQQIWAFEN